MAAFKINVASDLQPRLKARAAEDGFETIEQYIESLVVADIAGPTMNDEQIGALLRSRRNSPTVEMNHADFERMRRKLKRRLGNGREPKFDFPCSPRC